VEQQVMVIMKTDMQIVARLNWLKDMQKEASNATFDIWGARIEELMWVSDMLPGYY
jgi:hypothetical protein